MRLNAFTLAPMLLGLSACATPSTAEQTGQPVPPDPMEQFGAPLAYAKIGETVYVDGPRVTPLEVLEDSRCHKDVRCVWAGQVRIKLRVHLGTGDTEHEMTLGKPINVADGMLLLLQVQPEKDRPRSAIMPGDYRFGFRFMGGL